jgi:hypothetical protein
MKRKSGQFTARNQRGLRPSENHDESGNHDEKVRMNTQTHIIMGAALFGGTVPKRAWAGALGGIMPDIPMLAIVAFLKLNGVSDMLIFGALYWQPWWQITNAIAHNFFLWSALAAFTFLMKSRAVLGRLDRWSIALAFSASGLLHTIIDFLVHREDAHMQFWPLTNWKFVSPVSYWDRAHYGQYVMVFEILLGLALAALLLVRFRNWVIRCLLGVAMVLYVAVPAYFILT